MGAVDKLVVVAGLLLVVVGTSVIVRGIIVDVHGTNHRDDHVRTGTGTGTAPAPAPAPQPRGDTVMPVAAGGAGAVEEGKGFYAGRPVFKVPPSSPCRAEAVHY